MSKTSVFYKMLVLVIVFLIIGISVVTSTGNIMDNISSNTKNLNKEDSSKDLHYRGNYGYAYNVYPGPEETFYFPLDDITEYNPCGETISADFLYGGTIDCNGIWYASQYGNGLLYGIDTNNGCDMWSIGGGGSGTTELAWDDETALLYIIDGYNLYWYDPDTSEGDYLGNIDVSITQIEFDNNGVLYGFEILNTGNVYTIDLSTFETTHVGTLTNITQSFILGVAFDKDTNNLYLLGNYLYLCDTETYKCTRIGGNMSSGIEMTSFVIPYGSDDTTPPVTTHSLDPSEPTGLNGWYVSDVNVTLTATDDISGVKEIRYTIYSGGEQVIPGDNGSFILNEDGQEIYIEYWAIDNAGNVETKNLLLIDIDQTEPEIDLTYETLGYSPLEGWEFLYTAIATDAMSGMERVEFYINNKLMETVYGKGPEYCWYYFYLMESFFRVMGFIRNLEITDEYVKFYAIAVKINGPFPDDKFPSSRAYDKAGNVGIDGIFWTPIVMKSDLYLFQNLELPNNYEGHIGKYFIWAMFDGHKQPG